VAVVTEVLYFKLPM